MSVAPLDLSTLNPQQSEAVTYDGGPMMIIAGAGSGKTRVITTRIARLLQEGVPAYRILAVTFTNKASREMRERIEHLVGDQAKDLWMGTFHSVCARLLRRYGNSIGLDRSFVVYDDSDQMTLVRDLIKKRGYDDKSVQPRAVLAEISRAKEKLLTPGKYQEQAAGFFERIVANIYPAYNEALKAANALDFDDILMKAVRMLDESEQVRTQLQDQFLHVLVDEYQDVNFAQYKLADTLAGKHRNITVVGDDDQSIYGWRGADVSLMMRFSSDHPDAKVITLAQNYRSTQTILDGAYHVVKHNQSRNDKKLWTDNKGGASIVVREAGTENDEAKMVCDYITREVRTGRREFGDFAVLYRTNAQSRVVEEAFLTMRVPHVLVGGQRFYDRKEIKDMISYLRVVLNPMDELSLRRVINTPTRGIGPGAITKAETYAEQKGIGLFSAFADLGFQRDLNKKTLAGVQNFVKTIENAKHMANSGDVTPVLKEIMSASGYLEELRRERTDEAQSRLENLQELVNVTAQYDAQSQLDNAEEGPTLSGFLESVALVADVDALTDEGNAVTLMTLHSSKGLEFPVVFLLGLEEGVFPHSRSLGSDSELEEERRLCYVGMTRAKENLFMTFASRRSQYGQANFNPPSRFLGDIPPELLDMVTESVAMRKASSDHAVVATRSGTYMIDDPITESRDSGWSPPFQVGQKVTHRKFGEGVVVACNPLKNDAEVTVAFPGDTGIKKMVQSLAKLEAV
ncbi:MAG: UvrD-helicase domain-containing protein [Fimbriimonadaceae bacterium]